MLSKMTEAIHRLRQADRKRPKPLPNCSIVTQSVKRCRESTNESMEILAVVQQSDWDLKTFLIGTVRLIDEEPGAGEFGAHSVQHFLRPVSAVDGDTLVAPIGCDPNELRKRWVILQNVEDWLEHGPPIVDVWAGQVRRELRLEKS